MTNETATLLKPFHLPGQVLFAVLNDSHYQVSIVDQETAGGIPATRIRIVHRLVRGSEAGSTQEWWFDRSSYLPIKVTYLVPGQSISAYLPVTYSFSSWSSEAAGLIIPHQLEQSMESDPSLANCTILGFKTNTQPASALFDAQ